MLKIKEKKPIISIGSITAAILLSLTLIPAAIAKDVLLRVGIVQRFGDEAKEKLTLSSTSGDNLTLRVVGEDGQSQTLQTNRLQLEVIPRPLASPILQEKVILSDHATFETAENSAKNWAKMGIKVEITQPGRWQVWAKREVYENPLVRRWLLTSLQTKGHNQPYINSVLLKEKPQVSFQINGVRYFPKELEIESQKNLIQVTH
ncbi:MAG: amidase, partial [Microcystis sp. M53600_WE12]|nr:amidase [Microcystis sp. M53600_WE12]